jgi:hypothetical protein
MLSKIETGQAATSLDTLSRIAQSLGVSLSHLFRNYDVPAGGAQLVKNGAGMEVVRRGTRRGHTYHLLAYDRGPKRTFEPFLIAMDDASEVFPSFEHPGTEFIYMLKGQARISARPANLYARAGRCAHVPRRCAARAGAIAGSADLLSVDHRLRAAGTVTHRQRLTGPAPLHTIGTCGAASKEKA